MRKKPVEIWLLCVRKDKQSSLTVKQKRQEQLKVMLMAMECEARTGAHIAASTPLWCRTLPAQRC